MSGLKNKLALLVFHVLICVCNVHSKAILLSHKSFLSSSLAANRDLAVNIKIFNVGDSTAYDVSVEDSENWPNTTFQHVGGLLDAKWDQVAPGSNVSQTFFIRSASGGVFENGPARLSYRDGPKAPLEVGYTTSLGRFYIDPNNAGERKSSAHLKEWMIYILLSLIPIAPSYLLWQSSTTGQRREKKRN
mmetsp:Transcript_9677/g.13335  ORF Transcript_9677/g.13335 Transcript_9677/m.13335 type:complete len:189 (+) Transcript_9677:64-630(+)